LGPGQKRDKWAKGYQGLEDIGQVTAAGNLGINSERGTELEKWSMIEKIDRAKDRPFSGGSANS